MNMCIIEMPSVTFAQKAKAYIREYGYKCDIVRNMNSCGYSISTSADYQTACSILDKKKIPYKNKGGGAAQW